MRIGTDGDMSRRLDLEAWAAQMAAMHLTVSRMSPGSAPDQNSTGTGQVQDVAVVSSAESVRAQVLASRQGQMTVQDGLGYLQLAGADIERSQEALRRMRVVAAQAADGTFDAPQREALQKYVDRGVQDLEGIAEQARYHTLRMLGGTAATWSLPERAATQAVAVANASSVPAATRPAVPTMAVPDAALPPAGVSPVVSTAPSAVPPTTRPDQSFGAGYETRTPGSVFPRTVGADPRAAGPASPGVQTRATAEPGGRAASLAGRAPIGTAEQARDLLGRIDSAADILTQVGAAVDAAEQSLMRTIGELGLDQVRLGGQTTSRASGAAGASGAMGPQGMSGASGASSTPGAARVSTSVAQQIDLQNVAAANASVLVEATRAQFDAVTTVLGGAAAAAAVGAHSAVLPRDAAMAARPAVEPVTTTTRSSRTQSGQERGDRGGSGSNVSRR